MPGPDTGVYINNNYVYMSLIDNKDNCIFKIRFNKCIFTY